MPSATEQLRHLLYERGIKHFDYDKLSRKETRWESPDGERYLAYTEYNNPEKTTKLTIQWFPTPEDAIAATLGERPRRNTYYIKPDGETWKDTVISQFDDLMATAAEECSIKELKEIDAYIVRQLAEEKTCHETKVHKWWRGCSECGYKWEFMYGIGKGERPAYCPQCGRKVVG